MKKKEVISVGVSTGAYRDFITGIVHASRLNRGGYVCVANVHMIIEAYNNSDYSHVVNNAAIVTPDGKPLTLLLRLLYNIKQPRVAGMDLLPDLLQTSEKESIPVFFYGSTDAVLEKVRNKIKSQYPDLIISGMISPPFGPISPELLEKHIHEINRKGPGIVFVVLGCPKQEKMMAKMSPRVKGVMIGVGAAVPVFAGEMGRAPAWMQKCYLEWLFRLFQEPGRLWKRYLYTNTKFIFLAIGIWIRIKIFNKGVSV